MVTNALKHKESDDYYLYLISLYYLISSVRVGVSFYASITNELRVSCFCQLNWLHNTVHPREENNKIHLTATQFEIRIERSKTCFACVLAIALADKPQFIMGARICTVYMDGVSRQQGAHSE